MTDGPTNRINRPSGGWPGGDDAHTQRTYQSAPPTSQIHPGDSNDVTRPGAQAWSQDTGYYREPSDWQLGPDAYPAHESDPGELAPRAWFRSAPTYLLALSAVAVLTAGGGLAYTLSSSEHPAPAHPSVQPAPQQQANDVAPAPQAPPPAQDEPPAPAPDAPVSAPDDGSGSAPNFVPAPQQVHAPDVQAPAPEQQPDPVQQVPVNQPDPNQQVPNNQPPDNGQIPNTQQHPGHHHPPNNPENQQNHNAPQNGNGNVPQNQNGNAPENGNQNQNVPPNQNGNGNAPQNGNGAQNQNQNAPQNQNGNGNGNGNGNQNPKQNNQPQKPESANDTLCHPKPPPC